MSEKRAGFYLLPVCQQEDHTTTMAHTTSKQVHKLTQIYSPLHSPSILNSSHLLPPPPLLPDTLGISARPQDVQYRVLVIRQHQVSSVVKLEDHMVGHLPRAKLKVHHSVHPQLADRLKTLVADVFS